MTHPFYTPWVKPEDQCPAHNGTYGCVLAKGHEGPHRTKTVDWDGGKRYHTFVDNYSPVKVVKLS